MLEEAKGAKELPWQHALDEAKGAQELPRQHTLEEAKELPWQHTQEEAKGAKELGPFSLLLGYLGLLYRVLLFGIHVQ